MFVITLALENEIVAVHESSLTEKQIVADLMWGFIPGTTETTTLFDCYTILPVGDFKSQILSRLSLDDYSGNWEILPFTLP
jgi:hypothetical protein